MVTNPRVRIIDGSTAFRVSPDWVYGMPELDHERRSAIRAASRVTNPGCWATCTCLLTRPLVSNGLFPGDFHFTIHGVSGYTGGGKTMIARWESPELGLRGLPFPAPYAFDKVHKHMPEIMCHGLLRAEPSFSPSVGAFARGMRVEIPLHAGALPAGVTARSIRDTYGLAYAHERFVRLGWTSGRHETPELRFDPRQCNDTNDVLIHVMEHPSGHVVLMAILDNLGKGASGAAVQTLNLMLGLDEDRGLVPDRP
jgi:N-acetyl-gamma-glutamyl-phosphate reductase